MTKKEIINQFAKEFLSLKNWKNDVWESKENARENGETKRENECSILHEKIVARILELNNMARLLNLNSKQLNDKCDELRYLQEDKK
jgi:hypothetical protein